MKISFYCSFLLLAIVSLNGCSNDRKTEIAELEARIEQLSKDKSSLEVEQAKLGTEYGLLQKQLGDVQTKNKTLEDRITELQTENTSVREQLAGFKGVLDVLTAKDKNKSNDYVDNFVAASRRMLVAYETGLSFLDFEKRLIELKAAKDEALAKLDDASTKAAIEDFVASLEDADSLWRFSVETKVKGIRLLHVVDKGKNIDEYVLSPLGQLEYDVSLLGNRWRNSLDKLIDKYDLRGGNVNAAIQGSGDLNVVLVIDNVMPKIFDYASNQFLKVVRKQ